MPSFPIVDAHVHLWDPQIFRIPWLAGDLILDQRYGVDTFNQHSQPQAVEAFVYVEVNVDPTYALLEARHVAAIAANEPRLQAIVAWAPLFHGRHVRLYLDALVAISPLIRGVRQVTQGEADPHYVAQPAFVEAVQLLPRYGLTCDICIKHPQLAAVIELVQRCPETTFMLDHIAKPDIAAGQLDPWRAEIRQLAALPNVFCKISGMVTEADLRRWQPSDLAPYVDHIINSFGEDRIAFGGDWPVVLLASSYQRWIETLEQLTLGLSHAAKQKLWRENARRFYRLG
jgi:L-fuconolactonase